MQYTNDLVDEDSGIIRSYQHIVTDSFEMMECPREGCAAWQDFKKRLEEHDMTKEEVQALIDAAKPKVYTSVEECPKWAQGLVREAVEQGIIKGDGTGRLNLTDTDLKTLSMVMAARKGSV